MKRILRVVIVLISVVLMVLVWPVEIFTNVQENHNGGELPIGIELSNESVVEQTFSPEFNILKGVKIYLGGSGNYYFTVQILDSNEKVVLKKECQYAGEDCFYEVSVGKRLKKDNEYYMRISFENNTDRIVPIIKVTNNINSLSENKEMRINNTDCDKIAINMYIYRVSQHWLSYLIYDAFIVALALGCWELICYFKQL